MWSTSRQKSSKENEFNVSVVKKSNSAKAVLIAVFRQTSHSQDSTQPEHCQCCKLGHHLTYANHVVPTGTTVTTNPVDWVIYKTRGFFFLASSTTFWFCGPCLFCLLLFTLCLWLLWFKLCSFTFSWSLQNRCRNESGRARKRKSR